MLTLWNQPIKRKQNGRAIAPIDHLFDDFFDDVFMGAPLFRSSGRARDSGTVVQKLDDGTTEISVPLPGMSKNDIEVKVESGRLTVSAEAQEESRARSFVSSYTQSWSLGPEHDTEKIDAAMTDGVLTVTVPPSKEARGRTVMIR